MHRLMGASKNGMDDRLSVKLLYEFALDSHYLFDRVACHRQTNEMKLKQFRNRILGIRNNLKTVTVKISTPGCKMSHFATSRLTIRASD